VTYTDTSKELAAAIIAVDDSFILMTAVVVSSETSAPIHQATRRHLYLQFITVRLTSLAHSVCMKPNFQGLPWSECDGLGNGELLTLFLFN
jgi:hypothetical protein